MRKQLQGVLERRVKEIVGERKAKDEQVIRKKETMAKRNAEIVKTTAVGNIIHAERKNDEHHLIYQIHWKHYIKQRGLFYIEEEIERREAAFKHQRLAADNELPIKYAESMQSRMVKENRDFGMERYSYDRLKAVQYAERWWNDYNPAYEKFDVDCTNYVSQCLFAGGAPMRGYPDRTKGWWYRNRNWSYSWSVANALKVYLEHSTAGLRAAEVQDPRELQPGDIICYDFQGDGRYDHNTIVTGEDADGMPLVNAHTYNSRMRYWAYEDSSAYTPNIQYKLFHILDGQS
ncbi:amidase domain-containing protein [Siminovitchia sediminis]|uniref:Amidase domain-containing protein n=1 Tax=Siminovitchia sediminis TaxID=1274353 RepID=A0ABW4KGL7_9BACI